jgi:hypothetical protein
MSASIRLRGTGPTSARRNIAVTAAMAELHRACHDVRPRIEAYVMTLSERLRRVPPMAEPKALLLAALSHHWRCSLVPAVLATGELNAADQLLEEGIGTDAFPEAPFVMTSAAIANALSPAAPNASLS